MKTEKEQAQKKFIDMMEKTIQTAKAVLDRKVVKAMNAVDSNGNVYSTEAEIIDAYGYDRITDNERRRLLKALEYKEDRPHLKEDYIISYCRRALRLIDDDNYMGAKERKKREINNEIAEIKRSGGNALICGCLDCGVVVGELTQDGQRREYPEYTMCSRGRVCKDCLRNCHNQCKERDC